MARWHLVEVAMTAAAALGFVQPAGAATISWKGRTWNVTAGGMAGVCQGNAANVSVDASGFLHLRITNSGGTFTAAELFSTEKLGVGTYEWQLEGPTDTLDKNTSTERVAGGLLLRLTPSSALARRGNGSRESPCGSNIAAFGHMCIALSPATPRARTGRPIRRPRDAGPQVPVRMELSGDNSGRARQIPS